MTGKLAGVARKRGAGAAVVLLFLLLACVFTRPLITRGADHAYEVPYDSTFQAWTLSWDLRALARNPFGLFDANIFFPNPNTLAYSDHQIVTAVMSAPLQLLTGNPLQSANYMLIFNFFLCALGAYLLVLHLTSSRWAALVSGIAFAFAPPRLAHMGHLQLSAAAFIPLCLLFLHRYSEEGRPLDAALAGLFLALETLSTWYYGMILAFAILVFLLVRLAARPRAFTTRWLRSLAISSLVAVLVVLPFGIPYVMVQGRETRFERKLDEVELFSADVRDYGIAPKENLLWGSVTSGLRETTKARGGETERTLFPGLVSLVLGAAGAVYLFAKGRGAARFDVRYYVTLAAASFLMSLGSSLYFFGGRLDLPMPYDLFYYGFPGFRVMRVPARFVILVSLSLAVLSGFAVKGMLSRLSRQGRGRMAAALAASAVIALLLVDLMSGGVPVTRVPTKDRFPPVYEWLARQPGDASAIELPLADYNERTFEAGLQYEQTWAQREGWYTYYSTLHWKRIFNGYSGFIPDSYYRGVEATRDFPSEGSMAFIRETGVDFVILHGSLFEPERLARVLEWERTRDDFNLVRRFGRDCVFTAR